MRVGDVARLRFCERPFRESRITQYHGLSSLPSRKEAKESRQTAVYGSMREGLANLVRIPSSIHHPSSVDRENAKHSPKVDTTSTQRRQRVVSETSNRCGQCVISSSSHIDSCVISVLDRLSENRANLQHYCPVNVAV